MTMDASGNVIPESGTSSDSDTENVTVTSETQQSGISLKGENVEVGDVAVRKEDLILGLLLVNLVIMLYD